MSDWFLASAQETLLKLRTSREGLDAWEAKRRLGEYGENVIPEQKAPPWWQVFLSQFQDLLVMILIGAAGVSMVTGDPGSAGVIFAVLLLNALLGTVQNQKARRSLESLKALSAPQARVRRAGLTCMIPSAQIVPGDILLLEAGDRVGADARILESRGLRANESSLTGESVSVEKEEELRDKRAGALADQANMVFAGSLITGGRGTAVVVETGLYTQLGRIALMMNDAKEKKTPLQISLDRFSGRLAAAIMALSALVFILGLYRKEEPLDALMFAVALAVAAIPEALSSIVTIVQAMGTQKMAREQAIIKNLKAVESLGCVSVICSDKTGTLTAGRMAVEEVSAGRGIYEEERFPSLGEQAEGRRFLMAAALNNNASGMGEGDPMEEALLRMVLQAGEEPECLRSRFTRLREWPFDSRRKWMAVACETPDGRQIFVKGAPDVLLKLCSRMAVSRGGEGDGSRPLTEYDRRRLKEQNEQWARRGMRVLAFAFRDWTEGGAGKEPDRDLIFLGMAAMIDPPRPESRPAVAAARAAGIRTVMITGDHRDTAAAIARRLGILKEGQQVMEGGALDVMDDRELAMRLEDISVYARVSPEHKIRIVSAWQKRGRIVAMTGDGVNDAPALKQADIGVAMGEAGTEVSKEAADMILADDNFATIIKAVSNGRNVYRNIKNAIQFLLSGNMAGIFCVIYTSLSALPMPFAPVHLLFINLLTDSLPAIAIGMEPPEEGLLKLPPRDPSEGILTREFVRDILVQGGLIAAATLWAYRIGLTQGGEGVASTMAFSTLTLTRLLHGFNCRSSRPVLSLGFSSNLYSVMAFELGAVLLGAVLFIPGLQRMFAAADLRAGQLLAVCAAALVPTLIIQAFKAWREGIA